MPNVPRIEAFHADQAVTICCEVLTFVSRACKALSDQEETLPPHHEILSGLGWLAQILSNTLAEVERNDP